MGQRLNIEIRSDGERIANAYYHWSAYSMSAATLTEQAIDKYYELHKEVTNRHELAVAMLVATGGGMDNDELKRIKFIRKLMNLRTEPCNDRNAGLIAVTEQGMDDTERWEEGRVSIDLDTESISFGVIDEYERDEFEREFDEENFDTLQVCPVNFADIPFEDMHNLMNLIEDTGDWMRTTDGYAVGWIG